MKEFELKQIFENFNKNDIYHIAKEKGLRGVSKCTKEQLINRLSEYMLVPKEAEKYFVCQQDEQIAEFEKAVRHGGPYMSGQDEFLLDLYSGSYLGMSVNGEIVVPDAVGELYKQIATKEFHEKRKIMSHLLACLRISGILYGITPIDIFMKLLNQQAGINMTEEELQQRMSEIPPEYMEYVLADGKIYHVEFYPKDRGLEAAQGKKKFYIPSLNEIRNFAIYGSFTADPEFIKLRSFFENELNADEELAETACRIIQKKICGGCTTEEIYDVLKELDIFANTEYEFTLLTKYIQNLWNDTRMLLNRGFTPNELNRMQKKENRTILPLAKPENSAADVKITKEKIYPNDPCPCGSGKKYKKCCGKA